ncbi:MAG: helix-turn-helix domain-containing protein [Thermosynechococcaceae cyanobacterium MS004]|nr:helix-turn-helix domain-containing protein [Thermosynechococcaceae cyanobacterium MS004]
MLLKSSHDFLMQLDFAQWFLLRRRSKKLSQADIAQELQVTAQTVSNWENAKSVPTLDPVQFYKLCLLLDVSVQDLAAAFSGESNTSN